MRKWASWKKQSLANTKYWFWSISTIRFFCVWTRWKKATLILNVIFKQSTTNTTWDLVVVKCYWEFSTTQERSLVSTHRLCVKTSCQYLWSYSQVNYKMWGRTSLFLTKNTTERWKPQNTTVSLLKMNGTLTEISKKFLRAKSVELLDLTKWIHWW